MWRPAFSHMFGLQPWDMARLKRPELRALIAYYDQMDD